MNRQTKTVLEFQQVEVAYGQVRALRDVNVRVAAGEVLAVVGESGSGKSTLLRAAMGLLEPAGRVVLGSILYRGPDGAVIDVAHASQREMGMLRGSRIALVFQDSLASLVPVVKVADQFLDAVRATGDASRAAEDAARMAGRAARGRVLEDACARLARLNVEDPQRVLESYPFELSGGLGQRVGIAMALAARPHVLLADEPTSALDAVSQKSAVAEISRVAHEEGAAVVLATHNMGVVRSLADTVVVLKEGVVVEQGPAKQVLAAPRHPFTRELMEAVPMFRDASALRNASASQDGPAPQSAIASRDASALRSEVTSRGASASRGDFGEPVLYKEGRS